MQMETSPLRLLSVCFHILLASLSPRQRLFFFFSFSWPWLYELPLAPFLIFHPVPPFCQAPIFWALSQSPVVWLHCEIGARTIYSLAGIEWRTWLEDNPEWGKPWSCRGWIWRMVLVDELFMFCHNLSLWAMCPASCFTGWQIGHTTVLFWKHTVHPAEKLLRLTPPLFWTINVGLFCQVSTLLFSKTS